MAHGISYEDISASLEAEIKKRDTTESNLAKLEKSGQSDSALAKSFRKSIASSNSNIDSLSRFKDALKEKKSREETQKTIRKSLEDDLSYQEAVRRDKERTAAAEAREAAKEAAKSSPESVARREKLMGKLAEKKAIRMAAMGGGGEERIAARKAIERAELKLEKPVKLGSVSKKQFAPILSAESE